MDKLLLLLKGVDLEVEINYDLLGLIFKLWNLVLR